LFDNNDPQIDEDVILDLTTSPMKKMNTIQGGGQQNPFGMDRKKSMLSSKSHKKTEAESKKIENDLVKIKSILQ